ncbi:unnamed protein product [Spirodela intermedia]|uniref:DNA mismatch repair protein MSH3 n=1 Tax=Spirodela intermedia TaxID=51605 RepID=A0A7I8IE23_SPIIN|nr:unnamed protein product [Spirodela intermedia]CAA6655635.1 unnamed protein product [Spirodela intermedia]
MGKQKQQPISRFFAPKTTENSTSTRAPEKSREQVISRFFAPTGTELPQRPHPSTPPKVSATSVPASAPQAPVIPPSDASLHQRFVRKLLESPEHSSASLLLESVPLRTRSKVSDVLLMVEVGYRYRFFGEDAETAAKVLGIISHVDHNFLTASIPTFRLNFHLRRLVSAGHKVGVVKQQETAVIKAHGSNRLTPFLRGLSALYTKSTIEAAEDTGGHEEGLTGSNSNYLFCVVERSISIDKVFSVEGSFDVRIGIVAVEISTGDVIHGEFNDNVMRSGLEAVLLSVSPVELLLGEPISAPTEKLLLGYSGTASEVRVMCLYENKVDSVSVDNRQDEAVDGKRETNHHLGVEGIIAMSELAVQALALTIRYLKRFGFERMVHLGASFRPLCSNFEMSLSANTLCQLEVLKNKSDGSIEGTLLNAMNHTHTSFGLRLLKHWVNNEEVPSGTISKPKIGHLLSSVLTTLGRLPDLQRGITRIFYRTATSAEFITVMHTILLVGKQLQRLHLDDDRSNMETNEKIVRSGLLRRLIMTASSSSVISHSAKLVSCLNKDAADQGDMLHLFNLSQSEFPDVLASLTACRLAEERLDLLIIQYRKKLGIRNLEFATVSGTTHLIELASEKKVPSDWVKISSTKKVNRYHPPEVLKLLDELLLAKEEFAVTCKAAWNHFLTGFGRYYAEFQAAVQALAALDCLYSLAFLARKQNFVRPVFVDDDEPSQINIQSGRHPVLEAILGENFVPNDTNLHAAGEFCQIVTGPNMGGKSCYIRQVALISIMAQVGSFVPASSAKFHVLDGIYTRMGASDSILQGRSTFLEELSETSQILLGCSSRSLVIIDELGRGTSTHDGFAIAYATLHHLLEQKKCMILFVTHYPKMKDIRREFVTSVGTYRVSYLTNQKILPVGNAVSSTSDSEQESLDITFLYKVICGASDKSFGLNVARLAQVISNSSVFYFLVVLF